MPGVMRGASLERKENTQSGSPVFQAARSVTARLSPAESIHFIGGGTDELEVMIGNGADWARAAEAKRDKKQTPIKAENNPIPITQNNSISSQAPALTANTTIHNAFGEARRVGHGRVQQIENNKNNKGDHGEETPKPPSMMSMAARRVTLDIEAGTPQESQDTLLSPAKESGSIPAAAKSKHVQKKRQRDEDDESEAEMMPRSKKSKTPVMASAGTDSSAGQPSKRKREQKLANDADQIPVSGGSNELEVMIGNGADWARAAAAKRDKKQTPIKAENYSIPITQNNSISSESPAPTANSTIHNTFEEARRVGHGGVQQIANKTNNKGDDREESPKPPSIRSMAGRRVTLDIEAGTPQEGQDTSVSPAKESGSIPAAAKSMHVQKKRQRDEDDESEAEMMPRSKKSKTPVMASAGTDSSAGQSSKRKREQKIANDADETPVSKKVKIRMISVKEEPTWLEAWIWGNNPAVPASQKQVENQADWRADDLLGNAEEHLQDMRQNSLHRIDEQERFFDTEETEEDGDKQPADFDDSGLGEGLQPYDFAEDHQVSDDDAWMDFSSDSDDDEGSGFDDDTDDDEDSGFDDDTDDDEESDFEANPRDKAEDSPGIVYMRLADFFGCADKAMPPVRTAVRLLDMIRREPDIFEADMYGAVEIDSIVHSRVDERWRRLDPDYWA
jgi:uncharacterized protein (UPF0254 family)